jgi:2-polyprenyl-3-methyl-5-hydroxy-6-metoxy-1,4-benzoquinol methylase
METLKMPPNIREVAHWDEWNAKFRQSGTFNDEPTMRRTREALAAVRDLRLSSPKILEVGCGTGWLTAKLAEFGTVVGVDLGAESIRAAAEKLPGIEFKAGDILEIDLPSNHFDVVVTLETLSHVADKDAFMEKMAYVLKPRGTLILTTQNKFVFDRCEVAPNIGWTREWVAMARLKKLLHPKFSINRATSLDPKGHKGILWVVNSGKLTRLFAAIIGESRVKRLKEAFGFGQTLFVVAVRR